MAAKLPEYVAYVSNKFGTKPKVLRSDNGTEYTGKDTQAVLKRAGIEFQTSVPYNLEQNGLAERKNRTLCESGRSMLFDANLPTKYWGEAVMTACYIQNRLPTTAVNKTPYELWNDAKPNLTHIRVLGSKAYAHIPAEKRRKWDSHSVEGVLVGYSETWKGYRILNPSTSRVTVCRTVVFDECFVTSQKFISVSGTVQLDTDTAGEHCTCSQQSSTQTSLNHSLQMIDDQLDVDVDTDVDVSSVIEQVPVQKESTDCERPARR